jgi:hypothetical protein
LFEGEHRVETYSTLVVVRVTWLAALLFGCSYKHGVPAEDVFDGSIDDIDGPAADARVDTPPNTICFGAALFVDCYEPGLEPTGAYEPIGQLDTSDSTTCTRVIAQPNGPELCLRTAGTISIGSYVRFKGSRPLVLLATDTIDVATAGTLDVSSFRTDIGAGANTGICASVGDGAPNTSTAANAGAAGGGGGGFGTAGGRGGAGRGVAGGEGGGTTALAQVRGGCHGARGGTSSAGPGGEGGHGGGAVYLIAGNSITIAGAIRANGSGGNGGTSKAGGGGGGSGGLIAFDTPVVTIATSATMFANGGGGGEGGGASGGGSAGEDPKVYSQRALGGHTNPAGGDGGGGSLLATTGVNGGTDTNGGGGGGGGAGRIKVYRADVPVGKLSPPAN